MEILLTADEEKYSVKYKLQADFKILGQRLKKDMPKVKKALQTLSTSEIKSFLSSKKITIHGHVLDDSEIVVQRFFESTPELSKYNANMDGQVIVLLDCEIDDELYRKGFARELINRVQRLRKKANMVPTDNVRYFIMQESCQNLLSVLDLEKNIIEQSIKSVPLIISEKMNVDIEEDQEILGETFKLMLLKLDSK
eukprot:NODE_17_length_48642_cov_1.199349.p31 type:complete len:196 gc:universal NODE_17_length_48642_cov_1.199349:41914-41327(-)